jgi:hypothetical protein
MPRACTICAHENRHTIDHALVGGEEALRTISDRFGVSKSALIRHKDAHLPAALIKARKAEEVVRADELLSQVRDLQGRTLSILTASEEAGELRTALGAIREARGNLELLAKLLGELDDRPQVNLLVSPEWLELRAVIVGALEPHPEARGAVLRAIEGAGNGRA